MVFAPGGVTNVVAFVLYSPVLAYVGVQVGWAGVFGGAAGDDEGELFADGYLVQVQNVSADAAELGGVGELGSGGVGGPG